MAAKHLQPLLDELSKNAYERKLEPFINNVEEITSFDELYEKARLFCSTGDQMPARIWEGKVLRPLNVPAEWGIRTFCRMEVYGDGSGVLFLSDCSGPHKRFTARCFSFRVCDHEFTAQNLGRCYNQYTCKKCGYQYRVDSSD